VTNTNQAAASLMDYPNVLQPETTFTVVGVPLSSPKVHIYNQAAKKLKT